MKMNSFIAGICLFFSSLFSCQQKGDFKSVSVEDFSTLIADPEMQRLDVRTLAGTGREVPYGHRDCRP